MAAVSMMKNVARKTNIALSHTLAFSKKLHVVGTYLFPFDPNPNASKFIARLRLDARTFASIAPNAAPAPAADNTAVDPDDLMSLVHRDAAETDAFLGHLTTLTIRNTVLPIPPIATAYLATELIDQLVSTFPRTLLTKNVFRVLAFPQLSKHAVWDLLLRHTGRTHPAFFNHLQPVSHHALTSWCQAHTSKLMRPPSNYDGHMQALTTAVIPYEIAAVEAEDPHAACVELFTKLGITFQEYANICVPADSAVDIVAGLILNNAIPALPPIHGLPLDNPKDAFNLYLAVCGNDADAFFQNRTGLCLFFG